MTTKVFIFGPSGSGKNTAAERISDIAKIKGNATTIITPADTLDRLYAESKKHSLGRFNPVFKDGQEVSYEVTDFSVYNEYIAIRSQAIQKRAQQEQGGLLLILDSPLNPAWIKQYESSCPGVFENAYFLCIEADFDRRRGWVDQRNVESIQSQNLRYHTDLVTNRFREIPLGYITSEFKADFKIPESHIQVIDNHGEKRTFLDKISRYAETTLFPSIGKEAPNNQPFGLPMRYRR